jgi:dipeptidyl aminopeptidase/acylaminoacyl peptidase
MKKIYLLLLCAAGFVFCYSQSLTVEKIMKDPKWIGTSPSNPFWSQDSKSVYFNWNPKQAPSDSVYIYKIGGSTPEKMDYRALQKLNAENNAVYNKNETKALYTYRGDIYLVDKTSGNTTRITQTEDFESSPKFIMNDAWVVYTKNQNLYAWEIKTGITEQLTNIIRSTTAATPAATPAFGGGRGGGGFGGGTRGGGAGFGNAATVGRGAGGNQQEKWLQDEELSLMEVLKDRKEKRDQRAEFLKENRDTTETLKAINVGDKILQSLQISPDGRFITYRLYQAPTGAKNTIVPDYVTESGFTTDKNGRTKVGAPQGKFEFYVFDKERNKEISVSTDDIPGITDAPDYVKDYPKKFNNRRSAPRGVMVTAVSWNETGSAVMIDIQSQDNKDRWIMQLHPETGKLSLIDRQRDEAWIGGPGIGFGAKMGWLDDHTVYFQSEATGYSHVYSYDLNTHTKKALTSGKYEVQDLVLSKDKQKFYLLTNEEHPGKQNWYRMKTDGSGKEKITSMTGGYEVTMSPDEKWIAYRYSYTTKPWELYVQENEPGKKPVQVTDLGMSDEFKNYHWRDTKVITITARDGQPIYTRVFEPAKGKKNKAAVIFVHGAGYLQNVHYWWSSYFRETMFNNLLADLGYTVIDLDYRASSGYGRDWRTGIYRFMGGKDLDDNVDAAKYLVDQYGIDPKRIGIYGGSYGGFMTLMALFTTPDVFKAGAALRPVTDWAHYNHGYTSNILNEPFNDSIAYARSSPINFAAGLKNHLLICHGMVDMNVNFQDAVRLSQRLIELGKDDWELAAYPMEDHGFVEPSSWTDEYKRILKLFNTWLLK